MILPDAADLLARRAAGVRLSQEPGASSFFSRPSNELDPHLFNGAEIRPEVRHWILSALDRFWSSRYARPAEWSHVWIAGSGITFQWNAPRSVGEPGDLDILIGVDFPKFWSANPLLHGLGETATAERFNDEFRSVLDPETSHARLNGQTYEVTFYVNPGATDIRNINPYAAYDLTANTWTVTPPRLPADWDPFAVLPPTWFEAIDNDREQAGRLISEFASLAAQVRHEASGSPRWVNAATALHERLRWAAQLFDEIHNGRHAAFGPAGNGYDDYANVRWQYGKLRGYIHDLHTLKNLWESAHANRAQQCLGMVPLDSAHALAVASLVGASDA